MKAKEYYILVKEAIDGQKADELKTVASEIILNMNDEVEELCKKRHVQFDRGIFPIIKEMNDKWNVIVRLVEKDYGQSPLLRDGYKKFWINQIPELEGHV